MIYLQVVDIVTHAWDPIRYLDTASKSEIGTPWLATAVCWIPALSIAVRGSERLAFWYISEKYLEKAEHQQWNIKYVAFRLTEF